MVIISSLSGVSINYLVHQKDLYRFHVNFPKIRMEIVMQLTVLLREVITAGDAFPP